MSRKWSNAVLAGALVLAILALPVVLIANRREDVKDLLNKLEDDSNRYKKSLDSALDGGPLDGSKAEDEINGYVDKFRDASKKLRERYEDNKTAKTEAQEVLTRAKRIDGFMRQYPLTTQAQNDWQSVRNDLDGLARIYNVNWTW